MTSARRDPSGPQRGRKVDEWRGLGSFGTLGLEIVLCIALGFFGGKWLDEKIGTTPYLSLAGFVFGLAAAIKGVMRAHAEMQALAAKEEREQGNPAPLFPVRDDERKDAEFERSHESVANDGDETSDDEDDADEKGDIEGADKNDKKKVKR